ncbi:hypothetical protein P3S67_008477 [Capsicum chacoense]
MAEGFLKLENDFEGEAEKCLQELVDRCLVLAGKKSLDGTKIRSCKPFKRVTGDKIDYCPYSLYRALLTPVHRQLRDHDNNDLLNQTRSIFSFHLQDSYYYILKSELLHFKLLSVLELRHIEIDNFPTFIEIWGLMQLRHLKLPRFYLPDCPSGSVDKGRHLDFSNSQTISYLYPRCCTKEVIMGIQNVKELGICGYETDLSIRDSGLPNNLVHLQQLETLSIILCFNLLPASAIAFPAMLKKLKLEATALSWSYLDIIAELPNLEVLKLMGGACRGYEWHPNVRGFTRLKFLLISDNSLKYWRATDDNFLYLSASCLKKAEI